MADNPLLEVVNLKKYFPVKEGIFSRSRRQVHAVDGISFNIFPGEIVGLVGESGCGKSTVARLILRLIEPTEGIIRFNGEDLLSVSSKRLQRLRQEIQIIFQDPYASLNPRMKIGKILEEPLLIHRKGTSKERKAEVARLLSVVGLPIESLNRYPHEFSGGQRQRIGIARALALRPKLIVADEPVSSLDVSIQAQIINLLADLKEEYRLSILFIAHDLNMVRHISNRVAVMYLGRIVELASAEDLFKRPLHPYTQALLAAVPVPDPRQKKTRTLLEGDLPSPIELPKGCRFYSRCPKRMAHCETIDPAYKEVEADHLTACHLY
jgi:oligopeptide/dipeptide ABC transporter ATP-binding protein